MQTSLIATKFSNHIALKFLCLISCCLVLNQTNAQIEFEKTYGGSGFEIGNDILPTADKGFIMVGATTSIGKGGQDCYVVKIDSTGNQEWQTSFGGTKLDYANSVTPDKRGGYVVLGTTESYPSNEGKDFYLIKINEKNEWQWDRFHGGERDDNGLTVKQTFNGGFILFGESESFGNLSSRLFLVKTDTQGVKQWQNNFGTFGNDYGGGMDLCSDGGYIMTGSSDITSSQSDILLVKCDSMGNETWKKFYGGLKNDAAANVIETLDKGFALIAHSESYGNGDMDILLIKTDSAGNVKWSSIYATSGTDKGVDLIQLIDSSFTLLCSSDAIGNNDMIDYFLIHTDKAGDTLWTKRYGGFNEDYPKALANVGDSGVVLTGETRSFGNAFGNVYTIKTSVGGDTIAFPVKTLSTLNIGINELEISENILVYPNPVDAKIHFILNEKTTPIYIEIWNTQGILVREKPVTHSIQTVDVPDLNNGLYFYKIVLDNRREINGKIIISR